MTSSGEIRDFLTSRRARVTPREAGLPRYGGERRVPGLRRGEVAQLAGISVEYYTRLERGNVGGVSESVLAANRLGEALYAPLFDGLDRPPNLARFLFFDPRAPGFMTDWDAAADDTVAILRAEAGRDPYDRVLSDLIGELSTRSEDFRTRWAAHDVKIHRTGTKRFHHPTVGEMSLDYEVLDLSGDGQMLVVYTAAPGSPSADALNLLASWAHTPERRDHEMTGDNAHRTED